MKTLSGFAFYHAPFDIIDKSGHFYEVKCPSDRLGKHKGECRISISEDELKFGEMGFPYTIMIIFNGQRFDIPFKDLRERIIRNKVSETQYGTSLILKRQVTIGKKFLSKYYIEEQKGM
jgi:hypothetical protein